MDPPGGVSFEISGDNGKTANTAYHVFHYLEILPPMRIEVKIVDDDGTVLSEHRADASTPSQWRPPTGQRFVSDMPRQSDSPNTGSYELFGISFQPHVRIDRPNGYVSPPPGPSFSQLVTSYGAAPISNSPITGLKG